MQKVAAVLVLVLGLCGCTEDSFRQGGHDMLSGMCAKSANCSVSCSEGQKADGFGHCVPSAN